LAWLSVNYLSAGYRGAYCVVCTDCPRNVNIPGVTNNSEIYGETDLRCSANGSPPPLLRWTNLTGDIDLTGSTFTVKADTYYVLTCTATNNITYSDGRQETCSNSYTVILISKFLLHVFHSCCKDDSDFNTTHEGTA